MMPISVNDPRYRAEKQPQSLVDLGTRLKRAYSVGGGNFGIKGNEYHDSGFHRSRNWILFSPDSSYGTSDYSVQGSRNHSGDPDNDCAFDFTPGVWGSPDNRAKMIELTKRLRAAARANDPRLSNWYEFAGTEDGVHVVTFYAHGGVAKTPFDKTHLDHIHGSKFRDNADDDDTGLGDIMLGIADQGEDDDDMGGYAGITINGFDEANMNNGKTNVGVPGGANRKPTWFVVTNDTSFGAASGPDYALRIAAKSYGGGWTLLGQYGSPAGNGPVGGVLSPGGIVQLKNGETLSWKLPDDTRVVSVVRVATPTALLDPIYDGPLGAALEV
jgi:hypothetical protein